MFLCRLERSKTAESWVYVIMQEPYTSGLSPDERKEDGD